LILLLFIAFHIALRLIAITGGGKVPFFTPPAGKDGSR
jgi:hypothetical protein